MKQVIVSFLRSTAHAIDMQMEERKLESVADHAAKLRLQFEFQGLHCNWHYLPNCA